MTVAEVQNLLDKQVPLKLHDFPFEEMKLEEFVENFINHYNVHYDTVIAESNELHTKANRHRSLTDIYPICKYYYPDVTVRQLKLILNELANDRKIYTLYCNNIQRRTYFPCEQRGYFYNTFNRDEFGWEFDLSNVE